MASSIVPQHVADPVFEDFVYVYRSNSHYTDSSFPSTPSITNSLYTFSIAKAGYKAVGVVKLNAGESPLLTGSEYALADFDYSNQVIRFYVRVGQSNPTTYINATIKYMRL